MSTQITLMLPNETYRRDVHLARLTGRDVAEVLATPSIFRFSPLEENSIRAS